MIRVVLAIVGVIFFSAGTASWAQGPNRSASKFYPDSSDPAETLLRNAANLGRDGQWAEAISIYQRIIDQYSNKVARLPKAEREGEKPPGPDLGDEFGLFVDLRVYCHRSLAKLPAEARAIYRERIDGLAERWFVQGKANRDVSMLRRVLDLAFCSSWGDDAIELLGDIAFQEGRFGEALAMYRRLVLDRPDDVASFIHPDPNVDLARVAAKKILARAAAGEDLHIDQEIEAFSQRYPDSAGALAGRNGPYGRTIRDSLANDHLVAPLQPDSRWPTFAGSQTRTRVVAAPVDVGSLQWKVPLERITLSRGYSPYPGRAMTTANSNTMSERLLGYHPIVIGDQVIVADGSRILAYNLNDRPVNREGGVSTSIEPAWKHDPETTAPQVYKAASGIPRYTLTAVGNRIYGRMGPATPPFGAMRGASAAGTSYLIAIDWSGEGRTLWARKAQDLVLPNQQPTDKISNKVSFEGTPVADGKSVYVAVTDRREQTATYVACFDAESGSPRWARYLGAASSDVDNFIGMGFSPPSLNDYGHRLLSLDGPYLYYQTNLGAVISIEAETGTIRWVANYPRQDTARSGGSDRDLNPAVVHDGLVIVAPSDASEIYAFDADSGRLVWKTEPLADEVKLTHLLGVAKGRLVATGDRVLLFDVKNGKLAASWPDSGRSEGYGRGLLAGNRIYWPTKDVIEILDQGTAQRAEPPIKLMENYRSTGGNLVAGDGYLIVAQPDALTVFCQNSKLIERYREEIAKNSETAPPFYRLARAAEALGQDSLALESYESAKQKAQPAEMIDGVPLVDLARDHEFRLLLRLAANERSEKREDAAGKYLERASSTARSSADRLRAKLLLAEVRVAANQAGDAVEILGQALADENLRNLTLGSDDGHRAVRSDLLISDRLAAIVRDQGRASYQASDQRARELFELGSRQREVRLLEEIPRLYPIAEVVPDALMKLGRLHEEAGRLTAAAQAYKRLIALSTLSGPTAKETRARALWRLGNVYEAQNYLASARDAFLQLQGRFPQVHLQENDGRPLIDVVTEKLSQSPFAQVAFERSTPSIPIPLERRWNVDPHDQNGFQILVAVGSPPGDQFSRFFLVRESSIGPINTSNGQPRWFSEIGEPATWVGYLAEKVVVATNHHLIAFEPHHGNELWRIGPGEIQTSPKQPNPFTRADLSKSGERGTLNDVFHDFHLAGNRLFHLRGEQELVAIDGETGAIEWSFSSTTGPINPRIWVGAERILIQLKKPRELVVLETETGRQLTRTPMTEGEELEREPVAFDEDHLLLVTDRRTVKNYDMDRGQFVWDYRESLEMPVNGPPRVIVNAERLLVLHDGRTMIRLDPQNGSKRWSTLLGLEDLSERKESIACDDHSLYCVSQYARRQMLRAIDLEKGTSLWSRQLTGPEGAQWAIVLSNHCIITYPSLSGFSEEEEIENLPIVIRRQEDGAPVQRLVLRAMIAKIGVRLDPRGALVTTPQGLWALLERSSKLP